VDMSVITIPSDHTHDWILNKHYAKRLPSISFAYGLYEGSWLKGVCTYGRPASPFLCRGVCGEENAYRVYELNRVVLIDGMRNAASYLISRTLKMLPGGLIVVSYADTGWGHLGKIYQATNWIYTGITKERTDIGFEDNLHSRHYDKGIDTKAHRKFRTAKHRYVYFTGTKKDKKQLKRLLRYEVQPYPKGDSKRYEAGYQPASQLRLEFSEDE